MQSHPPLSAHLFKILAACTLLISSQASATWVGIVGHEQARTVQPTSKSDVRQLETILQGNQLEFAGLTWDNTTAAKWRNGNISVARNWAFGYFNQHHGLSIDVVKGDWSGKGPVIGALGYAYKQRWQDLSLRINPAVAAISNKLADGSTLNSHGAQLNIKLDYRVHPRLSFGFHPQYAYWQNDTLGSTLKLDFNATFDITDNKRHKLMLVHEQFLVNNRATDMKTRYVGENSPIAGYVTGTEATFKIRYAYVF
ncbi:hypothetical protein FLM48_19095 [Shewanella sp. Scap07]|uniref:hypothetical protein n=1 Tax=Shewanella sp. Scap07 TaxID=2589987 RepID=UPI0015BCAA37|nr:hypothetical protein [Shewanella sp. Scap07]QLE86991.1 hypothetical protein FLM48_19095 [Shewanella sp. Scap07]